MTAELVLEELDPTELEVLKAKLTGTGKRKKNRIPELDIAEAVIKGYLNDLPDPIVLENLS